MAQQLAPDLTEPRRCALDTCGKVLVRRQGESPSVFRKRMTCGQACGRTLQDRGRRRGQYLICAHCQEKYWAPNSAIKVGRVFCSRECKHNHARIDDSAPRYCALESCGKLLTLREGEPPSILRLRTTCGGECARRLSELSRRQGANIQCEHCKKEFWATPSATKAGRVYCSRKCKGLAQTERHTVWLTCAHCQKQYTTKNYQEQQYCSQRCMGLAYTSQVELVCQWCEKRFLVQAAQASRARFCSQSCAGKAEAQKRIDSGGYPAKVKVVCHQCGEEYEVHPYRVKEAKYCDNRCQGLALARHMGSVSPTTIEAVTYAALDELGIEYLPQHQLGRFLVDAFLPALNTVVEVQGDYFHCNPVVYPNGPKRDVQRKTIAKDQKRFVWLGGQGYRIVQLWERDIRAEGARAILERMLASPVPPSPTAPS